MSRLRLAVVGVGHLGRIHAKLAASLEDAELVAVADASPEAREAVAAEHGCRAVADFRDLIGEIDAAVVATPTVTHRAVATDLLRAGVHALVEKPICPTAAEADELVQLAQKQHLVLQVGHVERFNPAFTAVRGRLHDPKYIEAERASGYTGRSIDVGVVMDLMIHDIDAVLSLVQSPVEKVEALGVSVFGGGEDIVNARLKFATGCVATLTASRVSYAVKRSMKVYTPTLFASIDFGNRTSTVVEPTDQVLNRAVQARDLSPQALGHLREALFQDYLVRKEVPGEEANAILEEQRDFLRAIRTGESPVVSGADGCDAVAIAEQVIECVETHQWDGSHTGRIGPHASPLPAVIEAAENWSTEDTVVLRRKAG